MIDFHTIPSSHDAAKASVHKKGTIEHVWDVLRSVPDPEVPVLSVVDLGVVRTVQLKGQEKVSVDVTPTYSGCPATALINASISVALEAVGYVPEIHTVLSPAWTSDWMSEQGREKLREYGIAPPSPCGTRGADLPMTCPHCGSSKTKVVSEFGSTACKALFKCESCLEPFEYFKCI